MFFFFERGCPRAKHHPFNLSKMNAFVKRAELQDVVVVETRDQQRRVSDSGSSSSNKSSGRGRGGKQQPMKRTVDGEDRQKVVERHVARLQRIEYRDHFLRPPYTQPREPRDALEFFILAMDTTNTRTPLWDVEEVIYGKRNVKRNYWDFYVRVFGVTAAGHSVCCYLSGWKPYVYVEIPSHWTLHNQVEAWLDALEDTGKLGQFRRNLAGYSLERRQNIYGYNKDETMLVLKVSFHSASAKYKLVELLGAYRDEQSGQICQPYRYARAPSHRFWLWDRSVGNLQQFINGSGITPCHWMRLEPSAYTFNQDARFDASERRARTQIDINAGFGDVKMQMQRDEVPPLLIESWDAEVMRGARDRRFPDSRVDGDEMFQIGTSIMRFGDDVDAIPCYAAVHCVKPTENTAPDAQHINEFRDEAEMLRDYALFTRDKVDADIRIGYNVYGFDNKYWEDRAKRHWSSARCDRSVPYQYGEYQRGTFEYGRVRGELSECEEEYGGSKAHGSREKVKIKMAGRVQFDLFVHAAEEWKMPRSLNYVAQDTFDKASKSDSSLQQDEFVKIDLPFYELHEKYVGDAHDRGEIATYCRVDTEVPLRVMQVKQVLLELIEISRLTGLPLDDVINKKQMARTFAKLSKYAHERNYMFPEFPERFVSDPHLRSMMFGESGYQGATVIPPVRGFHNTSVATLDFAGLYPSIMRGYRLCYTTLILDRRWLDDADTEVKTIEIRNQDPTKRPYTLHWAINRKGILYDYLTDVLDARANAKRMMKAAKTTFERNLMNARQLGLKVIANSTYGFTGASIGKLPNLAIAASVTHYGREMIEKTADCVRHSEPAVEVIYGDSVTGDTPVCLVRDRYNALLGTWLRGQLQVVCFERMGDEVCDGGLEWQAFGDKESLEVAAADGDDWSTAVWSDGGFTRVVRVIRHRLAPSKRMYRVTTSAGVVDVTEDHSLLLCDGTECTVHDLDVADSMLLQQTDDAALLERMQGSSGDFLGSVVQMESKRDATLAWLATRKAFGFQCRLASVGSVESPCFTLGVGEHPPMSLVRSVEQLDTNNIEYVYDIETESGHFHVGPGNLVVHNTDSVMLAFPPSWTREQVFQRSQELAAIVTELFPDEVLLEFEKVYEGYLLYMKKKYAGMKVERLDDKPRLAIKGLAPVRGDKLPFVKRVTDALLKTLLIDKDAPKAIALLQHELQRLLDGKVDASELTQEKKLTKALHEYPPQTIHVRVARAMHERDPGTAPRAGEIVTFVVVRGPLKVNPVDYEHYCANRKQYELDYVYYIENLMVDALGTILDLPGICDDAYRLFEPFLAAAKRRRMGVGSLSAFAAPMEMDSVLGNDDDTDTQLVGRSVALPTKAKLVSDKERRKKARKEEAKERGVREKAYGKGSLRQFVK